MKYWWEFLFWGLLIVTVLLSASPIQYQEQNDVESKPYHYGLLFNTKEVAELLNISQSMLANDRSRKSKDMIDYIKIERCVWYTEDALTSYLQNRRVTAGK